MHPTELEFADFINSIPQLAWMSTPEGKVYWFNDCFYKYTGSSQDEMLSGGWIHLSDEKLISAVVASWRAAVSAGTAWEQFLPLKAKDGSYKWFMARAVPVRNKAGAITRWVGTATDIDQQMAFQRQLTDTLDTMSDTFLAIDKDWKITRVNAVLLRETGFKSEDVVGRDFREVFLSTPETQKSKYWTEYHRLMADRVPVFFEEYYAPLDMWTATRAYPTSEGGFTIFSVDITKKKKSEQALQDAKEEAEKASRLKSAFLANMSHEIRTPLGAMLGFAEILRDGSLSAGERANYLEILIRNGEQLSVIINDILDLSKVEAGHLALEFLPTYPHQIMSDVVSLLSKGAQDKGLLLTCDACASTPAEVVSDSVRVRQVLLNLVNNAVKFTQTGSVKILCSSYVNEKGRHIVAFEVQDTGIGIKEDQRDRIFEVFVQADDSMTRRFGGTGLGLALSRRLARSLGGDVVVKSSAPERGSTFLFTFEDCPEKLTAATPSCVEPTSMAATGIGYSAHPLENLTVLVADDSIDNQKIISRFLTKAGASVEFAENGYEACQKALASDELDLVLMDIQMSVMDGYTATQYLRSHGYKKPIIALTAHALNEVRDKALSVGCTDHLSKPVNSKSLIVSVAKYSHLH